MSGSDLWSPYEDAVRRQAVFLRNPLPKGPGVCRICRSASAERYETCYPCGQHLRSSQLTADAVVPISYALKGRQHAHNLATYKFDRPSDGAKRALLSLGMLFLRWHRRCLETAAGGTFTHLAVVPSTRGRNGQHPLETLLSPAFSLPTLSVTSTNLYPADDRMFHPDRFLVPTASEGSRVLLLDDTWTTGARVQSLAHGLKAAGAVAVVAVVLGRHLSPAHEGSKTIVSRARASTFDIRLCLLEE